MPAALLAYGQKQVVNRNQARSLKKKLSFLLNLDRLKLETLE